MKSKDSQLLTEAYEHVQLNESLVQTLIVKPLAWVAGKILKMVLSPEKKFKFVEKMTDMSFDIFESYLSKKEQAQAGTLPPDQLKSVETWEKNNSTPEEFKQSLHKALDDLRKTTEASKESEYTKNWVYKNIESLKSSIDSRFERLMAIYA